MLTDQPTASLSHQQIPPERADCTDRRWAILGVLCLSILVLVQDNTILNVALPSLARQFHATTSDLQWMVDAYTLLFAGLLLTAGALGDRYGHKNALIAGLVAFGATSVVTAAGTTSTAVIVGRTLMGASAAFIMPATLAIITAVFTDPAERARAIAMWVAVGGVGVAIGPLLGGLLLDHFYWGSVFLPNVAVVAVAATLSWRLIPPAQRSADRRPIDIPGVALSVLGVGALVFAIIEGPQRGWSSGVSVIAFAVAAASLALFAWWEAHATSPMLAIGLFRNARFRTGNGVIIITFFVLFGAMFVTTQYLQLVLHLSPLQAGVRTVPQAAAAFIASAVSAHVVVRVGLKWTLAAGLVAVIAALLTIVLAVTVHNGSWPIVAALALMGAGIGLTLPPATEMVMGSVPQDQAGIGSAMNDTTRELGGGLGVAVFGSITTAVLARQIPAAHGHGARALAAFTTSHTRSVALQASFIHAMTPAMLTGAAMVALGGLVLVGRGLRGHLTADQVAAGLDDHIDRPPCVPALAR